MISLEVGILFFGLAAALSWGIGDFSGGAATKRTSVYTVTILSQFIGGLGMFSLALMSGESFPGTADLLYGAAAGLTGAAGIILFYQSLATGRMGVVAPITALTTAIAPIIVSLFLMGLPSPIQIAGFALALLAVWFVSAAGNGAKIKPRDLLSPVLAGLGFGLFFIIIDRVSPDALYWPLVSARVASVAVLTAGVLITRRKGLGIKWDQLPIIILVGIMDVSGNVFFLLATKAGRLDIAAVLASLYPAATVMMARIILHEDINKRQWIGIAAAIGAVVLLAI